MSSEVQTPPRSLPDNSSAWFGAGLLGLLVLAVYLPSFRGGFVWDDLLLVDQNPLVKGELTLRTVWFSTDFPLSNVALWLEWLAFGKHAAGYRIVNAALHAVSCVLLWRLLARLGIRGAWLAAALFAVHPVAAGSVAWISEIKNTLSLPLCLLSFGWYLEFEERHGRGAARPARLPYALSLLAFVLALLSKTSVVVLPVLLLLAVWWRRGRIGRCDIFQTFPFFVLALAFGLLTVWFQSQQTLASFSIPREGFATKLAAAGMAVWFYLGKALAPLNLCATYPRWEVDPSRVLVWLPLVGLLAMAALGGWQRRGWGRHLLFGLGCFGASLFPALGFFEMYFLVFTRVSDHLQYIAVIAPLAGVAALVASVRRDTSLRCLVAVLLLGCGALGLQRARVFAMDETLWRDTLAKNPAAWNAHNNLGCILAERNDLAGAMEHFTASVKLNPRDASAQCNLGRALMLTNDFTQAARHYQAALEVNPNHVDTLKQYGRALAGQQRMPEAVRLLRHALRLKPDAETRRQLAPLLSAAGRDTEAVQELRMALAAEPESAEGLKNLAWLLATSPERRIRNGQEAIELAVKACELTQQKDPMTLTALAAAYAEAGQFTGAIEAAERAITAATNNGNSHLAKLNGQLLRLYQQGRPYHSPSVRGQ